MGCVLVAGGVGFLWVGLCFVVGKPLAARQCFLVGSLRWVFAFPPRFTLEGW